MRFSALPVSMGCAFTLALATVIGCGGGGGASDLGQVTGTITMDGKPLENAEVVFAPPTGRPSMGLTDSNGKYELNYIRDIKGAVPATHKVRITTRPEEVADNYSGPAFKEPIPAKYNADTTLTADVKLGENTFDFELKSR